MLEQMGKAGLAFRFVLRPDMVPDRYRDDRGLAVGGDDHPQAIGQRELLIRNVDRLDEIGHRSGRLGGSSEGRSGQEEKSRANSQRIQPRTEEQKSERQSLM